MYEYAVETKLCMTGLIAALTALWGWCGWLWVLWVLCLAVDHLSGTVAACRAGQWNSSAARAGIWGKLGSILVVLVTTALDFVVGQVFESYALPFAYPMLLSPLVLAWYILTEIGSILENAVLLGARLPGFLVRWVAVLEKRIGEAGERAVSRWEERDEE